MAVGEFLYLNVEHNPNDNMDNAQIVVKVDYIPLGQPVEVPQLYGYFVFNDIKELQTLKDALEDLAMIQRDRQGNFTSKYTMQLFYGRHTSEVTDRVALTTIRKATSAFRHDAHRQDNVNVEVL